jgi:hypothetical protein
MSNPPLERNDRSAAGFFVITAIDPAFLKNRLFFYCQKNEPVENPVC